MEYPDGGGLLSQTRNCKRVSGQLGPKTGGCSAPNESSELKERFKVRNIDFFFFYEHGKENGYLPQKQMPRFVA